MCVCVCVCAAGAKDFSLLQNLQTDAGGSRSLLFNNYHGSFPGVKRSECEATTHLHLVPNFKTSVSISIPHIYLRCMERQNYTLTTTRRSDDKCEPFELQIFVCIFLCTINCRHKETLKFSDFNRQILKV